MNREIISKIHAEYAKTYMASTDSRNLPEGCVFFCLKGTSFDANLFAEKALQGGARIAVTDNPEIYRDSPLQERMILVDDVLEALQQTARMHRDTLGIPVIGIGGSNGKTTTKELLSTVLSEYFLTFATKGNLNNHIGVPLTLLSVLPGTEMAVVELGTNQPGDIALLCEIADPDFGIITNIGKEHLEGFGDLEGVAKEESELYLHLQKKNGTAFVHADDEWLVRMASRLEHTVTYGQREGVVTRGKLLEMRPYVHFLLDDYTEAMSSHLTGEYNFHNILAAAAIARFFGVPYEKIKAGIARYKPTNNRSQVVEQGSNTFLLDCYNANPSSMEVALNNFAQMEVPHKWVVIGDMFELGSHTAAEHESIARLVASLAFEKVFCVGPEFRRVAALMQAQPFDTAEELAAYFSEQPPANAFLLLKASRGIALEKAVAGLI